MSNKPRNQNHNQRQVLSQTTIQQQVWNYPVPPPAALEEYRKADPRFADQFLDEWKAESEHRRKCEIEALEQRKAEVAIHDYDVKSAHRFDLISVSLSFVLIFGILAASTYFIIIGQPIAAVTAFVGALGLFVYKREQKPPKTK